VVKVLGRVPPVPERGCQSPASSAGAGTGAAECSSTSRRRA